MWYENGSLSVCEGHEEKKIKKPDWASSNQHAYGFAIQPFSAL
jgi:hypothetical protein